ncbi:hypothetical protein MPOCJGCO_1148 [Methylobacterium trifolii]|uniref:Acyltransferase 3 domain-containing protein n=1 Tax=Methylobacterium trifolii TaxID=1003092 RepID=A0ABQ4TWX1_9HYPH|nr:hypothetical protein MPOCJGCO_1148 [Methylobacterium trifolii]
MPFCALLHGRGPLVRLLGSWPMRRLGLYSYTFYLGHYTLIALVQHLWPGIGPLPLMAAAFPLTLAYCWLLYTTVERPCATLRRRLTDRPGRPAEPSLAEGARAV